MYEKRMNFLVKEVSNDNNVNLHKGLAKSIKS